MGEIIRRSTIEELVGHRNNALSLYEEAHAAIASAAEAIQRAQQAGKAAAPGVNSFNLHSTETRDSFVGGIRVPEKAAFLDLARKLTDTDVWAAIVEMTELEQLMDKEAKDQLRGQLQEAPPEVTVDNVVATLESAFFDADLMFKRGIANAFSKLDRRFRSHDGWKIGSRIILAGAFDCWGSWSYRRNLRDTLIDIERVFLTLDGRRPGAAYAGIVGGIDQARAGGGLQPRQTTVESAYFKAVVYKNGNLHLWFRKDALVRDVNRLLGEYYGDVIPEERRYDDPESTKADPMDTVKTTPAKRYGFFPTPPAAVDHLLQGAPLYRRPDSPRKRALEPSAGTGNIARPLAEHVSETRRWEEPWKGHSCTVDCVEMQPHLAQDLRDSGLYGRVDCCDFLTLQPRPIYDIVLMNPPFDRERDIDHVWHAMKFLKPEGYLAAIMSAGTEWRETRKAKRFREETARLKADWRDLPAGLFSEAGTNVNTVIVRLYADGRRVTW